MKRKAEKADIVKRKVFHEHIILLTEGRFLMLAVLVVMVWFLYLFVRDRMAGMTLAWWEIPFLLLVEVSLYYALLRQFWYRCFGRLMVTEDEIVWKCHFMRTVRLRKTEIRYTGIDYRWPGSARKAVTPVDMAYFPQSLIRRSAGTRAICCATKRDLLNSRPVRSFAAI